MNPGAPSRVGHTGYMWVYLERVSGGREYGKNEVKKEQGVSEEANKSWKFNEELHKACREISLENLT